MNTRSISLIALFVGLILFLGMQIVFLQQKHAEHQPIKQAFVSFSGLPGLAIANEALFVRFRSYADTFSLFSNGPELLEYAPSTFTYSPIHTPHPARIERAY